MNAPQPLKRICLLCDDVQLITQVGELCASHDTVRLSVLASSGEVVPALQQQPCLLVFDARKWGNVCYDSLLDLHSPIWVLLEKPGGTCLERHLKQDAAGVWPIPLYSYGLLVKLYGLLSARAAVRPFALLPIGTDCWFDTWCGCLCWEGEVAHLTQLESRLLLFFYCHAGEVLSRDAISQAIKGEDLHPLNRSIDMAVNRLRKKLGESQRNPRHLMTVWRKGYRFVLHSNV